jgi:hypothetical protein
MRIAVASTIVLLFAAATLAQTREAGPWWPNPAWGPGDQAGASNWVTPEKVLEAVRLVKTGKIYEIGQVYEKGMPMFGQRTYTLLSPASPTYAFPTANRIVGNDEFVCGEIGQVGTQFDGPVRYGWSRFWTEQAKYNTDPPGIGLEVARWVVARRASMVGSEVPRPPGADHEERLQHREPDARGAGAGRGLRVPVRLHSGALQGRDRLAGPSTRDPLTRDGWSTA